MLPIRTRYPDTPKGYPIERGRSWFSVIVPIARTNEVTNPSGEVDTSGYTAGAGSLVRSIAQQYHGSYSFAYTPSAAAFDSFFYALSATPGLRAVSCKFLGAANVPYQLLYADTGGNILSQYAFRATGRWQWVWCYYNEPSTATRRIYFRKNNSTSVATFYVDGVQSEVLASAAETVSTYIDGDQVGLIPSQFPPAYVWNGVPHASTSSRSGQTRAGGQVVKLDTFGFVLLAIIGLGLVPPQNINTPYALLDGAQYERTHKSARQFTLAGRLNGGNSDQLDRLRALLESELDRDIIAQQQPLILQYQKLGDCDVPKSDVFQIACNYAGGLEETTDNHVMEAPSLVFQQWLPVIISDGEYSASLNISTTVATANPIMFRSGAWQNFGSGFTTAGANDVVFGLSEYAYFGGAFTAAGGVANTRSVARYSFVTNAWTAMGSGGGASGSVRRVALAPNGDVYVLGNFNSMGGAATSACAARWNVGSSTWTGLNYPSTANTIRAAVVGKDGTLYTGDDGGLIYSYNGAWTLIGTTGGAGLAVDALAIGPDGNLYAGGAFSTVNAVPALFAARYTLSSASPAWEALGGGPESLISDLAFGPNGFLYAGTNVASYWTGSNWVQIGRFNAGVTSIAIAPTGQVYFVGAFTKAGNVTLPNGVALWTGTAIIPVPIILTGAMAMVRLRGDGTLVIATDTNGTATVAASTTVTNTGKARTYPIITFKGPSSGTARVYSVQNVTTGKQIGLNFTINAGETAVLTLDPLNESFLSDFQGDVSGTIMPGSNDADFALQPGDNVLLLLSSATITATIRWRNAYSSLSQTTN